MPKSDKLSKKRQRVASQATGYTPPPKQTDTTPTPFKFKPSVLSPGGSDVSAEDSPLLPPGTVPVAQASAGSFPTRGQLETVHERDGDDERDSDDEEDGQDFSDLALSRYFGGPEVDPGDDHRGGRVGEVAADKVQYTPVFDHTSSSSSSSSGSNSSSSSSESSDDEQGHDRTPAGGAGGDDGGDGGDDRRHRQQDTDMATPHDVKGSEALTLQTFDGTEGVAVHAWCRAVDRAIVQFGWAEEPAAAAAKQRLVGRAAFWLQQEEEKKTNLKKWDRLRKALTKRFHPVVTDLMATNAMRDLRQKSGESGGEFNDRVWSAIHLMNMRVETDGYQQCCLDVHKAGNSRYVRHLFGTGIHQTTRDKIYQSHNPPTKLDELLTAVRTVESETRAQGHIVAEEATVPKRTQEKSLRIVTSAAAQVNSGADDEETNSTEASDLDVFVEAMRKFNSKGKCFTCNKEGHWANKCPNKGQGGNSRGRKGNRWNGGRGRGRGSYQGQGGWRQPPMNFNYGGGNSRPVNAMDAAAAAYHQFQQQQQQQQQQPSMFVQWQQPAPDGQDFPSDVNAITNSFFANYPQSGN